VPLAPSTNSQVPIRHHLIGFFQELWPAGQGKPRGGTAPEESWERIAQKETMVMFRARWPVHQRRMGGTGDGNVYGLSRAGREALEHGTVEAVLSGGTT
jgi:hypothetical protein